MDTLLEAGTDVPRDLDPTSRLASFPRPRSATSVSVTGVGGSTVPMLGSVFTFDDTGTAIVSAL
jgi:hypothetical protein